MITLNVLFLFLVHLIQKTRRRESRLMSLYIYSIFSLSITLFCVIFNTLITLHSDKYRISVKSVTSHSKFMQHFVFLTLMLARKLNSFSATGFKEFARLSAVILLLFNWMRFLVITDNINNNLIYVLVFGLYLLAFLNSCVRLCFFIGSNIDANPENNIVYIGVEDIPEYFKKTVRGTQNLFSQVPVPPGGNSAILRRYGVILGFCCAYYGIYSL